MAASDSTIRPGRGPTLFTTTQWSIVLAAGGPDDAADSALESLCRTYWYPLYTFVRRKGCPPHEAQDLTQEFFARLLEKDFLRSVDRKKGKFRSFLLAALDHFLANEWRRAKAQKRGGKISFISLDDETAEQQYAQLAACTLSPEKLFEQQWALTLLDQVLTRLRQEFIDEGKSAAFEQLKVFLTPEESDCSYAEWGAALGKSEGALKMAVIRMRRRYRFLLREQIRSTVQGEEEVEEELRALFAALSS